MGTPDFAAAVARIIGQWHGVEVLPHRHGGVEFRFENREIGHIHAGNIADLPVPMRLRRSLIAAGRAFPHHASPESGWVSFFIRSEHDIPAAVSLFKHNYDRIRGIAVSPSQLGVAGKSLILGDRTVSDLPS